MLAYELYLRNKDSTANVPRGREKPIKKIYVNYGNKIDIDTKTLEEYGSKISDKYRILQESLIMPLNTSDSYHLNLLDVSTSTNQPNPYVEIRGNFKRTTSEYNVTLFLQKTVTDKDNLLHAIYDISNDEFEIQADKDIRLRIDTQNYKVGDKKLFDEYVNAGILNEDCIFSADLFTKIAKKFFSFVKSGKVELNKPGVLYFSVYVLPSDSTISCIEKEQDISTQTYGFTDSFGNHATAHAHSSTKTAKFLSFYEKAFTINCKQDTAFYQNIGIGRESLPHVFLPADQTFRISGLSWVFIDLSDIHQTFKETKRGILSQLHQNERSDDHFILVSTQVVEAGVDLSFSHVFREKAPLDSIIQVMGRLNREAEDEKSRLIVYEYDNEYRPYNKLELNESEEILKRAKDSTELYSLLPQYYKSISEKDNLNKDHSKQLDDLIAKLDFDGIWKFINDNVLDNTLENERDTVLIPDTQEWDGIKKLLMKKRLSKTDYRTFSNISTSLPKKVYDLAIEDYFDADVLEKNMLLPKKGYLSKVYDSILGTDKWLIA